MSDDRVRAAQYVRMSTEHQQYSTENRADILREYAAKRGLEIIRTFKDTQVIVTTHVKKGEVGRLRDAGVHVVELPPGNFLSEARIPLPS